jgi:hypothetical protein
MRLELKGNPSSGGICTMMDYVDDSVVDKLWHDLDGQVTRQQIARAVAEIAARFEDAKVTAFVPIFVHRRALKQLKGLLTDPGRVAGGGAGGW